MTGFCVAGGVGLTQTGGNIILKSLLLSGLWSLALYWNDKHFRSSSGNLPKSMLKAMAFTSGPTAAGLLVSLGRFMAGNDTAFTQPLYVITTILAGGFLSMRIGESLYSYGERR